MSLLRGCLSAIAMPEQRLQMSEEAGDRRRIVLNEEAWSRGGTLKSHLLAVDTEEQLVWGVKRNTGRLSLDEGNEL